MGLSSTTIWEVETTGSDTLNGGAFDPGQTAGMLTDGAATSANTSAPVFTSASYNFAAGDVGAWVYIASGTNWTAGWYNIASVSANAATLSAAIGAAIGVSTSIPYKPNTVAGCATIGSPTAATWSIDYSQQAAARFTYTDLASAGTGLTVSSTNFPFAKQQVGNSLLITGGTNFLQSAVSATVAAGGTGYAVGNTLTVTGGTSTVTATFNVVAVSSGVVTAVMVSAAGNYTVLPSNPVSTTGGAGTCTLNVTWGTRYVIASVAAGVATVVGPTNTTTGAGSSGTGGLGGCLASLVNFSIVGPNGGTNLIYIKTGTYSHSTQIGIVQGFPPTRLIGYSSLRTDLCAGSSRPILQITVTNTALVQMSNGASCIFSPENIDFDGNNVAGTNSVTISGTSSSLVGWNCIFRRMGGSGIAALSNSPVVYNCQFYSNGADGNSCAFFGAVNCIFRDNTGYGSNSISTSATFTNCVFARNGSGGVNSRGYVITNCLFYKNTGDGVTDTSAAFNQRGLVYNSIFYGNTGFGINKGNAGALSVSWKTFQYLACGSNNSGNYSSGIVAPADFNGVLTADPCTNGAANDFSLNTTAGGGAVCRAAGFPGVFTGGLSQGYLDIGAVQSQGGSGTRRRAF